MLKNRTEQHCWTTLIKTKARFLILSFGMWVTEFSSSAWNKALNNSKQIFFFFFSTVFNSANISAASEYRTSLYWYDNKTLTSCDEIWLLYCETSIPTFCPVSSVSLLNNTRGKPVQTAGVYVSEKKRQVIPEQSAWSRTKKPSAMTVTSSLNNFQRSTSFLLCKLSINWKHAFTCFSELPIHYWKLKLIWCKSGSKQL